MQGPSGSSSGKETPPPPYPGPPMQPVYPSAPPMHQSPQVVIQQTPRPHGGCSYCGGFMRLEYDTTCLIIVILFAILFFPIGLLGFCCIDRRPRCMQCGMEGGVL